MLDAPKQTRRWFRFGLLAMLMVAALVGTYVVPGLRLSFKRAAMRERLEREGVLFDVVRSYGPNGNPVRIRNGEKTVRLWEDRFFGDRAVKIIYFPRALTEENLREISTLFPEAAIWHEPSNHPPD